MAEATTYTGGCHCGRFGFEVSTDLGSAISCNCSICTKRGLVLAFASPEHFKLTRGTREELKSYQFNKKVIDHLFCPDCGVEAFASGTRPDGQRMVAINVRCLEGVELASLTPRPVDGRRF
jgi:hypothetical protein